MGRSLSLLAISCLLSLVGTGTLEAGEKKPERMGGLGRLSQEQRDSRLDHAKELLGPHYKKSVVRTGEDVAKINGFIYRCTKESLAKKYHAKAPQVAQAIIDEAHKHGFDPVFIMSVIQTESSFIPDRKGGVGEIGLMQLRPETAEWIAGKMDIKWKGAKSLYDPIVNIKIGTAYLAYAREHFDQHARLYLAAYNMGPKNVKELRQKEKWPSEYPGRVMEKYVAFYAKLKEDSAAKPASSAGRSVASASKP